MSDSLSSVQETIVHGDVVTTTTETKTVNADRSVTTTTTVDETDHADADNHITTLSQSTTSLAELDEQIIRQVEYYFSDQQYPHDEILQSEGRKDDGWIPLSLLASFKRLQTLPTDIATVLAALKKSLSGLLQIDEEQQRIRRHPSSPISTNPFDFQCRSVLVEGFPRGAPLTLDNLWELFAEHETIDHIQIQKASPPAAVLLVFSDEEQARAFLDQPLRYTDGSPLHCSLYYRPRSNSTGTLIHLAGMAANATRESIKAKFQPFAKMFWVDHEPGEQEAWVRLNEANTAEEVLEQVLAAEHGKLIIGEREVRSRIVANDEKDEQFTQRKRRRRETELERV